MPEQKKPAVPKVRARNRGTITSTLERYREAYVAQHPGKMARYVYHPEHKPELSKVLERQAAGYQLVKFGHLGIELPEGISKDANVRVADLVLMSVDKEVAQQLAAENLRNAQQQMTSVQSKYYSDIEQVAEGHRNPEHQRPGARPIGSAAIATKDFEYNIEQRGGDG